MIRKERNCASIGKLKIWFKRNTGKAPEMGRKSTRIKKKFEENNTGRTDERTDGQPDGRTGEWINGWSDGWTVRRTDRPLDRPTDQ